MKDSTSKKPPEGKTLLGDDKAEEEPKEWFIKGPNGQRTNVDKLTKVDRYQIEEKNKIDQKIKEGEKLEIKDIPGYDTWCKRRQLDQRHISRESNAKG